MGGLPKQCSRLISERFQIYFNASDSIGLCCNSTCQGKDDRIYRMVGDHGSTAHLFSSNYIKMVGRNFCHMDENFNCLDTG